MKAFKELDELVDHLRSKGVVGYKSKDLELTILPDEPFKAPKERKKSVDEILEGDKKRKGADGLTAVEQFDRYGVVMDAEE